MGDGMGGGWNGRFWGAPILRQNPGKHCIFPQKAAKSGCPKNGRSNHHPSHPPLDVLLILGGCLGLYFKCSRPFIQSVKTPSPFLTLRAHEAPLERHAAGCPPALRPEKLLEGLFGSVKQAQCVRAACLQNEIAPEKLLNRYEKRFENAKKDPKNNPKRV